MTPSLPTQSPLALIWRALRVTTLGMAASAMGCMTAEAATSAPATAAPVAASAPQTRLAIVLQDQISLRAAPRDSAQAHAQLAAGEVLEVRGERQDFLQVYEHRRERAGYVRAQRVKLIGLSPEEAPELLAVLRFLRDTPGSETLGIGYAAAWLRAVPARQAQSAEGAEVLDALGGMAQRLALRASNSSVQNKTWEQALASHLEVARSYGLNFTSFEQEGRMLVCYDGDAYQRLLGMTATAPQRARAAIALTRPDCLNPGLRPAVRLQRLLQQAQLLEQTPDSELPEPLRNRLLMRRASLWATLTHAAQRSTASGSPLPEGLKLPAPQASAALALQALSQVRRSELAEDDLPLHEDTAIRVNVSRWGLLPAAPMAASTSAVARPGVTLGSEAGEAGQTCLLVFEAGTARPALRHCSYSVLWMASASIHASGKLITLAAQPTETWRELWVLRKVGQEWQLAVLPPAEQGPELGYAEFAGFSPDGQQVLVARESRVQGKLRRSFEVLQADTLNIDKSASDPSRLAAFQRWQDAGWKRASLSLR